MRNKKILMLFVMSCIFAVPAISAENKSDKDNLKKDFMIRARVLALEPELPARIHWRCSGEGLGGKVFRGELTEFFPKKPQEPQLSGGLEGTPENTELEDSVLKSFEKKPEDRVIVNEGSAQYHYLKKGVWSQKIPVSSFKGSKFVTFTLDPLNNPPDKKQIQLLNTVVEFEFSYGGEIMKVFQEKGNDGPTVGIYIPKNLITKEGKPTDDPNSLRRLGGLSNYVDLRVEALKGLPWESRPLPKRYMIITDCDGYQSGVGYGVRNTNKDTFMKELKVLREIGVNGLRGCSAFFRDAIDKREGVGAEFAAGIETAMDQGYSVTCSVKDSETGELKEMPVTGCPYYPGLLEKLPGIADKNVKRLLAMPYPQVWGLTIDEIGSVYDAASEGKGHQSVCKYCIEGFREFLKNNGLKPEDFGARDWDAVRPNAYAPVTKDEDAVRAPKSLTGTKEKDGFEIEKMNESDTAVRKEVTSVKLAAPGTFNAGQAVQWLPEPGWSKLEYWSRRFNCYASALMFKDLQMECLKANAAKRAALESGDKGSSVASQPWIESFALRGNTFLLRGHSLDFFNFYRTADTAMVYETSNRDPRVWCWDSYLCDVGRTLREKMGRNFGIYIKPHRGAPIQRLLAFISRGNGMIFWYTYGPDYNKGDSFSGDPERLKSVSKGVRLAAAAEDLLFDAVPAEPVQVAVVRPLASEYFGGSADCENGKWVYIALRHAGIPVDPIDEEMLAQDDLSRYRVIVISGNNLPKKSAQKVAEWVKAGGVLYVNGLGCPRDESKQTLTAFLPVLGLKNRSEPEEWCKVKTYGSTGLNSLAVRETVPDAAKIHGEGQYAVDFKPVTGREPLHPLAETKVLASFADGAAALTQHSYGKGIAYCAGFYPGLEYSEKIQRAGEGFDMSKDFDPAIRNLITGPVLEAVKPSVTVSQPVVEALHVRNTKTGKQGVVLINWAYQDGGKLVMFENISVTLSRPGTLVKAKSAWTGENLPCRKDGEALVITIPHLEEGDVIFLE